MLLGKRSLSVLTLLALLGFAASPVLAAPLPWHGHPDGHTHWYEVVEVEGEIAWDEALTDAAQRGGYPATITSAEENEFITQNLLDGSEHDGVYWLGMDNRGDVGLHELESLVWRAE